MTVSVAAAAAAAAATATAGGGGGLGGYQLGGEFCSAFAKSVKTHVGSLAQVGRVKGQQFSAQRMEQEKLSEKQVRG